MGYIAVTKPTKITRKLGYITCQASLVAQLVKNLPAMWETQV